MRKGSKFSLGIIIAIAVVIFGSFSTIISFVTDYMWFKELGYTKTFFTKLITQIKIGIPTFLILFILITFYLRMIKKNYYKKAQVIPPKDGEKKLNGILGLISGVISLFISLIFAGNLWFTILQYMNAVKFGTKDPIFSNDLSFYIFDLPLLNEIINLLLLLIFMMAVLTVVFYMIMMAIRRPEGEEFQDFDIGPKPTKGSIEALLNNKILKNALTQIGVLGLIIFIIIAVNYVLKTYNLLYSPRGVAYGASYTDVHVTLWVYRIMAAVSVLSAIGFLVGARKRSLKLALAGPVLLIAISIVGNIGSGVIQKFIVEPDEISKEQQYLEYNIDFTQRAYGLKDITEKDFPVEQNLTKEDILNNEETIKNIRINDYRPLNQVYNQLQGIRLYYRFNDVDIDRYMIDGEYTQVFLSAREMDQTRLSGQAQTWINKYLKYTHGYGITLSPVNSVTSDGQPQLLIRDIPPTTKTDLMVERPEIYFGELTNEYIIVNTDEKEFDYPAGENNKETIYEGSAGIRLNGLNKLLFAINQGSLKLILPGNITSESRIVLNRNIVDRVSKIAPFIYYDEDPYIVANQEDGKLYWIIDGYTMSSRYPYSQPYRESGINYIRNSVKVVIDAYNGTTKYYVFDENDPIIMTYMKIFPELFLPKDQLTEGLLAHTRYPQFIFDMQSEMYTLYHMDNPRVFYNGEDAWDIAKEKYMQEEVKAAESNYGMFKLPEEEKAEFLLTIPYTPATKPNMTALLVARNDGENYGKLFVYKLPKNKTIDGTMMIESRIDQDSTISPQLSLWSQKGSNVLRGNVMVIPVENSILYVEPIYLQASNENSLPEVKKVIVAYRDRIVMEDTLDKALTEIFGQVEQEKNDSGVIDNVDSDITDGTLKELIKRANDVFIKAQEASQNGDWAKYGEYINQLENILEQMNIQQNGGDITEDIEDITEDVEDINQEDLEQQE